MSGTVLDDAIERFEERFAVTPEQKLEALHQVVKGIEPAKAKSRGGAPK